jgi:hypothetical protein
MFDYYLNSLPHDRDRSYRPMWIKSSNLEIRNKQTIVMRETAEGLNALSNREIKGSSQVALREHKSDKEAI